jgi:hypothetical protein
MGQGAAVMPPAPGETKEGPPMSPPMSSCLQGGCRFGGGGVGILHPASSCSRGVVARKVAQGAAVAPPAPGDTEEHTHEQLLAGWVSSRRRQGRGSTTPRARWRRERQQCPLHLVPQGCHWRQPEIPPASSCSLGLAGIGGIAVGVVCSVHSQSTLRG